MVSMWLKTGLFYALGIKIDKNYVNIFIFLLVTIYNSNRTCTHSSYKNLSITEKAKVPLTSILKSSYLLEGFQLLPV